MKLFGIFIIFTFYFQLAAQDTISLINGKPILASIQNIDESFVYALYNGKEIKIDRKTVSEIRRQYKPSYNDLQGSKIKFYYAELLGTAKLLSTKVTIEIDFGQSTKLWSDERLRNPDGSIKVFNSMIDALNFMGSLGWEFVQAYAITEGTQNVYHWLLRKSFEEVEKDIKFYTAKDFKGN